MESNTAEDIQSRISMYRAMLGDCNPSDPQYHHYCYQLQQEFQRLHELERPQTAMVQHSLARGYSSGAGSPGPSRKRSLGLTADGYGPEPKRVSAQPSPQTPSTPDSLFNAPNKQQWSLPSRPGELVGSGLGEPFGSGASYIDLTVSDPPSPVRPDPFPELEYAFCDDGARPVPADAFTQETMAAEELAQFLIAPTTANGGYGFQQQQRQGSGQTQAQRPVDFSTRSIPYLPDSYRPGRPRGESEDDENYGDVPLNATEADAIDKMLEIVQQNGDDAVPPDDREQTPLIMSSTLKEYQKIGLTWLLKMEASYHKGGILADEMGLGKTVQALALICARPSQDPLCKTTLIIAPVALMRQWEKEIGHHVKDRHKLSVYLYWGNGKRADFNLLRQHDVVLTTFGTLTSEFKQKDSRRESTLYQREQNEPGFRRKPRDKLALLGPECMWYRVIIDEAHMIKNRNSIQSKGSADLQAKFRLCLTGTPMMNCIDELFPLLRFLKVSRYNDWKMFAHEIAKPAKAQNQDTRDRAMKRVQILLKAVMLRRQKTSEVDGKPILNLPAKHVALDNVDFSNDETSLYRALEDKAQIQFNKYLKQNSVSANYACILVLLLRLRQACCHPHLIKDLSQPATEEIAEDDLLERARHLSDDVVRRLKDIEAFECPICFEADPNPTIIIPCGHTGCGGCVQKLIDPSNRQDGNDELRAARCAECRGDLKATLITDLKHFYRVFCPERLEVDDRVEPEEDENSDSSDAESDEEPGDDVDDKGNLAGFVVSDEDEEEGGSGVKAGGDDDTVVSEHTTQPVIKDSKKDVKKKGKGKGKGKGKARAQPKKTLAQLKKESLRSKAAKQKYLRRLDRTWIPSAKTTKVVELLTDIRKNDPTEKTLIFSQFTSLLDLIEVPLVQKRIQYQRYDGSMSMEARADAVEAFMSDPEQNVMMVSLKAGNAGLNLWRASQVIMLDPFWNPFVEDQAVDRAHRMPQEREVFVHRVLIPETVEDRICALQDKKRDIIGAALDENASKGLARLNVRELKYLFGMG
jgi:SNF2 family DNA or RNA helicase